MADSDCGWVVDSAQVKTAEDPTVAHAAGVWGELIQIDGCEHAWFEDRAPVCTALVFVDDATSRLMAVKFTGTELTRVRAATAAPHMEQDRADISGCRR